MRLYRDTEGAFHRTQADARASGLAWTLVEVPTDHAGLCAFLNALPGLDAPPPEPDSASAGDGGPEPTPSAEWRNGMPSPPPFMGSRHPDARSICLVCGRTPAQQRREIEREIA